MCDTEEFEELEEVRPDIASTLTHEILMETEVDLPECGGDLPANLRAMITFALRAEGVELPCEINVLLTDNEGIAEINQEMREKEAPTDVLSFPMFEFRPACPPTTLDEAFLDPESGLLPLGDMVLSLEKVEAQAKEYGHDFLTEARYLVLHSVLHLLGYDHLDEGAMKRQMRTREKDILEQFASEKETL